MIVQCLKSKFFTQKKLHFESTTHAKIIITFYLFRTVFKYNLCYQGMYINCKILQMNIYDNINPIKPEVWFTD